MKMPPRVVTIKCPHCEVKHKLKIEKEKPYHKIECPKCNVEIKSPIMQCCVICAFSKKKCPNTFIMEQKIKEIRKHKKRENY